MAFVAACAMMAAPALAASKAALGGKIVNASGAPVSGVKVLVLQPESGKVLFSATSNDKGLYAIESLEVGSYHLRIEPDASTQLRGDTVKADIPEKGLIVNWRLSATDRAVAMAMPGQVGGQEEESVLGLGTVQIGEYAVPLAYVAGGVVVVGAGIGVGVGLSGGGHESPKQ